MNPKEILSDLFPEIDKSKQDQLIDLVPLYQSWNEKVNVISRKDVKNLFTNHILHSLLIAKWISFKANSIVLDLGTGGGFPGIPLAILFPEVQFKLIDSKNKKCLVTQSIIQETGLKNASCEQVRGEELKSKFDFVVARAVASSKQIIGWTRSIIKKDHINQVPNGWILLKGGNLQEELSEISAGYYYEQIPLSNFTDIEYFNQKYIVYIQH